MKSKIYPIPFLGDFIGGEFIKPTAPNGSVERRDPGDLKKELITIQFKYEHVNEACAAAKKAFRSWADKSLDERKAHLIKLKETYIAHQEELAEIISQDSGKPLWEAKTEVQSMINKIDVTLNESLKLIEEKRVDQAVGSTPGFLRFKPRGVMAVIGPFNFPGHLPNGHIIPALITGNTVVFKPSELTPAVGQFMAQIFEKAGFPKGVLNVVQGDGEVGKRLAMHEAVEGVLFTGSYETGFRIKQDTLAHFWKILALEMGGKNASVVWDDCDIDKAVYENLIGAYISAGQRCSATSRIIVRKSVSDEFISKFHASAKKLTIGYGLENPFMGPLISSGSVDKYLRFQGIAKRENAEQIMRGKVLEFDREGHYVTPSINLVTKADPESVYQKSEVFGPNVAIYIVDEFNEALKIANQSSFGLVLSVFSKDRKLYDRFLRQTRVGLVNWNRSTVGASSKLPFGGMGKSGNNQPAGTFAIYSVTYPVACLEDQSPLDLSKMHPGMNFNLESFNK
ncbi:MAG: succinylglutamate-semialdehyde dehydrogenase [Oligoflexia bacterium]|nr:succinylglutamate-semialdehyde dehydrogenase [Oligoflexia bacterium]